MNKEQAAEILERMQEDNGWLDTNVLVALEDAIRALRGEATDEAEGAIVALLALNYNDMVTEIDDPEAVEMGIAALRETQLPPTLDATLGAAWSILESNSDPFKALAALTQMLAMRQIERMSLPDDWAAVQVCRAILNGMGYGVVLWCVADVLQVAPNLTHDEARQVVKEAENHHNAEYGINWETLRSIVSELFGSEHLVGDDAGQRFNVEDDDGEWHTIIAEDMEQAGKIALARGIAVSCIQEAEDEDVEDEGDE